MIELTNATTAKSAMSTRGRTRSERVSFSIGAQRYVLACFCKPEGVMSLNCKQGDLALVIAGPSTGATVTCLEFLPVGQDKLPAKVPVIEAA
jgi:hypothetical protein